MITVYDENRNVIATSLSDKRDKSAIKVFKMAVKEAEFYPEIVVTDRCHIYDFLEVIKN